MSAIDLTWQPACWQCACCLRILPMRAIAWVVVTEEGEQVEVGSDCGKKIKDAGGEGHTNEDTGATFFSLQAWEDLEG